MLDDNDAGINKWYCERFSKITMSDDILTTLNSMTATTTTMILETELDETTKYDDNYTGKLTTYLYCEEDTDLTIQFYTDDDGRVFLNDKLIVRTDTCTWSDA
jgi:hypothetical protein